MPLGDPSKASLAPAPIASHRSVNHKANHNSIHVPLAGAVPAFGADIYLDQFETFDALAPSSIDVIASMGGQKLVGGAFVDGDFAKLYAVSGSFGSNQNQLVTVDTATGLTTFVADATNNLAEGYSGLAYDTASGVMYAASSSCGTASHLWTIDPNTGATTLVGEITGSACIVGIAINAQGEMYGVDVVNDSLIAIDKSNANAAVIGSVGFNVNYAQDMAFDLSTGILYLAGFDGDVLTDNTYTVDLLTGTASLVGPIGNGQGEVDAMGIETVGGPCALPQDLAWLSLSPTSGTTPSNSASPIIATIDGTGTVQGDVLSGTVCATSNDPQHHSLAVPIEYDVQTGPQPPPTLSKIFAPADIPAGQSSTLTITLANGGTLPATLTSSLTDTFPSGMTVAATPSASTTCGGTLTAAPGTDFVALDPSGAAIPANGTCDIVVDVETASAAAFDNSIAAGALQTDHGTNAAPANATLTVDPPPPSPPTVAEQFNPASVPVNTPSTLTITLANSNATAAALTAPFTDGLPTGLVIAPTPNASTTCGGAVLAVANDIAVSLDNLNAAIPAAGSCTVQVDVQAASPGTFDNTIVAGTLQTSAGQNAVDTVATLTVTPLPPTIAKAFNPSTVVAGVSSTLTITLSNGNAAATALTAALTDAFPTGLVVAATPNASSTCGGVVTAVANAGSVTLDSAGSTIPASGSCTITVDVDSATSASYPNDIPAGALQTDVGANATSADATLDVTP